jgi:phytoene dehydrogenase-like protein
MAVKNVVIIGGGIAGLAAGSYLRMNGYSTRILELHSLPGGMCTAWKRKGYTFEFCIHWLVGSGPPDSFYDLWNELIDMRTLEIHDFEEYIRVEDERGEMLRVFTDINRLEKEMMRVAPEDEQRVKVLVNAICKFTGLDLPVDKAPELYGFADVMKLFAKLLPYVGAMKKWGRISVQDFANSCKNPLLKKTIRHLLLPECPMIFLLFTMAWMHRRVAGYPVGGSMKFGRMIADKYRELGGDISFNARVDKIVVEDGKARGVVLKNGESIPADIVISAADGYSTIFHMLDGKFVDDEIAGYYQNMTTFPSLVQISLGVARSFEGEAGYLVFPLKRPIYIDETETAHDLHVRIFNFDPTLASKGKTSLISVIGTRNHAYWLDLRENDRKKYDKEKERIAWEVIDALEKRFGDITSRVEVYDVSTPATIIRYTNSWKGSFEGWLPVAGNYKRRMNKELPGLKNFYMVGQWVEPGGGLPTVLMSGRGAAQVICKRDGKAFATA